MSLEISKRININDNSAIYFNNEKANPFCQIPKEIFAYFVTEFLNINDCVHLSAVNRSIRQLTKNDKIWQALLDKNFKLRTPVTLAPQGEICKWTLFSRNLSKGVYSKSSLELCDDKTTISFHMIDRKIIFVNNHSGLTILDLNEDKKFEVRTKEKLPIRDIRNCEGNFEAHVATYENAGKILLVLYNEESDPIRVYKVLDLNKRKFLNSYSCERAHSQACALKNLSELFVFPAKENLLSHLT